MHHQQVGHLAKLLLHLPKLPPRKQLPQLTQVQCQILLLLIRSQLGQIDQSLALLQLPEEIHLHKLFQLLAQGKTVPAKTT